MTDMMMMDPPNFVFGPNSLMPSAKIVGNMSDMKKLVMNTAPTPSQPGNKTASANEYGIDDAINPHEPCGRDEFHEIGCRKPSDSKGHERPGEKISGDLFRPMRVVLNVLDVVAPSSDLSPHIKKLGDDPSDEVGVMDEVAGFAVRPAIGGFSFFRNLGELGFQDEQRPNKDQCAQNQIRSDRRGASPCEDRPRKCPPL